MESEAAAKGAGAWECRHRGPSGVAPAGGAALPPPSGQPGASAARTLLGPARDRAPAATRGNPLQGARRDTPSAAPQWAGAAEGMRCNRRRRSIGWRLAQAGDHQHGLTSGTGAAAKVQATPEDPANSCAESRGQAERGHQPLRSAQGAGRPRIPGRMGAASPPGDASDFIALETQARARRRTQPRMIDDGRLSLPPPGPGPPGSSGRKRAAARSGPRSRGPRPPAPRSRGP